MPLIYLSGAWVAGTFLGAKFNPPVLLVLIGLVPLPLLFCSSHRKLIIMASLCLTAFVGGMVHFQSSLPVDDENHLQFYNGQDNVEIKGMVASDPEVRDKAIQLCLSSSEIRTSQGWQEVSGTALLFLPRYPDYSYGDVVMVIGKLETPPQLEDFDYEDYLAHEGIYSIVYYPKAEVLETSKGLAPLAWVYSLRSRLSQVLTKTLPEPQASLAQGIVLGIRGMIPASLTDKFNRTGTVHILAISGINLSILVGMLLSLGIWLFGRRHYLYVWLALGIIWLYTLITGMNPPVMRAAIMASLFLVAEFLGRQRSAATSLALAAAVMVGMSPQVLWQASFQLSFLAMGGLIFIAPHFQDWGRRLVSSRPGESGTAMSIAGIAVDSLSVTLGAILAVWPVVAYYFGIVSFAGPLASLCALPALSGIIITGILTGLIGVIALSLAQVIAWFAWLLLSYLVLVVNVFAILPLSFIGVAIDVRAILGYYLVLLLALWLKSHSGLASTIAYKLQSAPSEAMNKIIVFVSGLPKKWVIPLLLGVAILTVITAATMPDDKLHVSFLDVGQGDAILIQRGSQQVLVDGGPSPQAVNLELGNRLPFWDRTVELVVLSHPHADHLSGLIGVLQRYQVEQVLYPNLDYESPVYAEWEKLIGEKNIRYTIAQAGEQIDLGKGVIIEVLNPQCPSLTGTQSDADNNCVVLRVSVGQVSFLLTADTYWEAEADLIRHRADLGSTVLKVAHHGSDTSTTEEFLAAVNPQLAVISVGEDNSFGHPKAEVIKRLEAEVGAANIYRTDKRGTIEFITDGERLWVKSNK